MKIQKIAAFSDGDVGGNPAGVAIGGTFPDLPTCRASPRWWVLGDGLRHTQRSTLLDSPLYGGQFVGRVNDLSASPDIDDGSLQPAASAAGLDRPERTATEHDREALDGAAAADARLDGLGRRAGKAVDADAKACRTSAGSARAAPRLVAKAGVVGGATLVWLACGVIDRFPMRSRRSSG